MAADDFRINRGVKSVLIRHWVDTGKLKFRTSRGTVRFSGVLATTGGRASQHDYSLLEVIAAEVRTIPDVVKVYLTGVELECTGANREETDGVAPAV